jgi:putative DNA primase/helicase
MESDLENELSDIEINLTDVGNGRRLVLNYGTDLKWCETWKKWLVWDGKRWVLDDILKVTQWAKDTIRIMYKEAAEEFDENKRKKLAQHAFKCESIFKIKAMIDIAKSDLAIKPDLFDTNPWLLNVENGTLNLRTGELFPHIRENHITKLAPIEYDPLAECPKWYEHLKKIMADNRDLIDFLQSAYGYSLTGNTDERKLFIQWGTGANGKTTSNEVINEVMGDYAVRTPTETLFIKHDGSIPNDVAKLNGARFVFCSEGEEGKKLAESLIKDITGGDTISARFMRAEWFEFEPTFKVWLATNHKPVIRGTDNAIWDRINLIPFNISIPESERIPRRELMGEFKEELPGILAWMVRGCLSWYKNGLQCPQEVREATSNYRSEMDIIGDFIENRCNVDPNLSVDAPVLYEKYIEWAGKNGIKYPLLKRAFIDRMLEKGFDRKKVRGNIYTWFGIDVKGAVF